MDGIKPPLPQPVQNRIYHNRSTCSNEENQEMDLFWGMAFQSINPTPKYAHDENIYSSKSKWISFIISEQRYRPSVNEMSLFRQLNKYHNLIVTFVSLF